MSEICYSANNEEFMDDLDSAIDAVLYNQENIEDARNAVIYIGNAVTPKIRADWIFEYIQERAHECVYEQCGEYAENFEAITDYDLALKMHIQEWIDKLKFNCYSVKNIKTEPITDHVSEQELQDFFKGTCVGLENPIAR